MGTTEMGSFMFAPPPPPSSKSNAFSPAVVSIIAVLGSAFLVVSYYRIFAKLCTRWQARRDSLDLEAPPAAPDLDANAGMLSNHGLEESLIKKIPIFMYKNGEGLTEDTDCAVCLSEFEDNEKLRMLPKCGHAFHIACIDTWLTSHSSCPLCRAMIWPDQLTRSPRSPHIGSSNLQAPSTERMEFPGAEGSSGNDRRSSSPTLRGLMGYEDQQHHGVWMSSHDSSFSPDSGIELTPTRDATLQQESSSIPGAMAGGTREPLERANDNSGEGRSRTYFSTEIGPQSSLTRTASCKESHSRDRESRQIPVRRPSSRRNAFSIVVRSYSMGTSRRLVHALEFLDLEDYRSGLKAGEKPFSPTEYGITPVIDYSRAGVHHSDALSSVGEKLARTDFDAGSSSQMREAFLPFSKSSDSDQDVSDSGMLKSDASSPVKPGKSKSLRSSSMKRSSSHGRSVFSFRNSSKGRIYSGSPGRPLS